MKKSTRALVGLIVIDGALLAAIIWFVAMIKDGASLAVPQDEAIQTVTSIGGGAIGIATVILGIAFFLHRRAGN